MSYQLDYTHYREVAVCAFIYARLRALAVDFNSSASGYTHALSYRSLQYDKPTQDYPTLYGHLIVHYRE